MPTYEEAGKFIAEATLKTLVNEVVKMSAEVTVVATEKYNVPFISGRLRRAQSSVIVRSP